MWQGSAIQPEVLLAAAALAGTLGYCVGGASRGRRAGVALCSGAFAAGALALLSGAVWAPLAAALLPPEDRPIEAPGGGYLRSDACRACHPHEYDTWHHSYHHTMTQVATPEAVLGRFDGVDLEVYGKSYQLERRGDEFLVHQEAPRSTRTPAPRVERRVVMTTGSHHVQVYWFATGSGRFLDLFQFAWRIRDRRWVPIDSIFLYPPDVRQLSASAGRWNVQCNRCHATWPRPRLVGQTTLQVSADTQVAELGIACESCHGPGEEHVRRMRSPLRRYTAHFGWESDAGIVQPAELEPERSAHVCAQCHSVFSFHGPEDVEEWKHEGFRYRPGDDLDDSRLIFPVGNSSWPDGMIRTGGREFNGLSKTPCYAHGGEARDTMTCLSCHALHQPADDPRPRAEWANDQLAPGKDGNAACVGCHPEYGERVALEAHTHHPPDSSGSTCYNCHMPNTAYGLLKLSRTHQLDSPSAETALETGRPTACNLCHLDRPLAWAAETLEDWYGQPAPELDTDRREIADSILLLLRGDANQRALAAWHMGWAPALEASGIETTGPGSGGDWTIPYLSQLLVDPYSAPRYVAEQALRAREAFADLDYDFVADPAARERARQRVREVWDHRAAPSGPGHEALLLDGQGRLRERSFSRLLGARDDREVVLEE
jgi:hypothetical protein